MEYKPNDLDADLFTSPQHKDASREITTPIFMRNESNRKSDGPEEDKIEELRYQPVARNEGRLRAKEKRKARQKAKNYSFSLEEEEPEKQQPTHTRNISQNMSQYIQNSVSNLEVVPESLEEQEVNNSDLSENQKH